MIYSLFLHGSNLTRLIIERIIWSFSTVPNVTDWLNSIILIFIYTLITLPFGLWLNFLEFEIQSSKKIALKIITTSLIAPAILEELFFRVILLPSSFENKGSNNIFLWSLLSLFLFVIYHPVNAITFFPSGRETFFNPVFLFLATLLGLICTIAYLQSSSIWIPIAIHWFVVVIWLLCLGGIKQLKLIKVKK